MTVNTKIVSDILNYIGWESKSDWYVGIATDVSTRLFQDHNVDKKTVVGFIVTLKAKRMHETRNDTCCKIILFKAVRAAEIIPAMFMRIKSRPRPKNNFSTAFIGYPA